MKLINKSFNVGSQATFVIDNYAIDVPFDVMVLEESTKQYVVTFHTLTITNDQTFGLIFTFKSDDKFGDMYLFYDQVKHMFIRHHPIRIGNALISLYEDFMKVAECC